MEAQAIDTVLSNGGSTGTGMVSGRVGLKLRLKMPHRQTTDLCEHVVSWSNLEYPAATTTPDAFQLTAAISNLSSPAYWF